MSANFNIVSFSAENFKSFAKKETLYMSKATKIGDDLKNNFFKTKNKNCSELLKVACIYGANASGKTKFIEAMNRFCDFFQMRIKESGDDLKDMYEPFELNNSKSTDKITFEIKFIVNNILYSYTISYNMESILKEELKNIDINEIVFSIEKNNLEKAKFSDDFGNLYKDTLLKIEKQNYINTFLRLFESDSSSKLLTDIFKSFKTKLKVFLCSTSMIDERINKAQTLKKLNENKKNKKIITEMVKITCGFVSDFIVNEKEVDLEKLPNGFKEFFGDEKILKVARIKFRHRNGEIYIEDESMGTQIVFGLSGTILDTFETGGVLFIDELDKSLHPDILVYLIKLFQNKKINKSNAQLIFTTHNDILLDKFYDKNKEKDSSLLRRDQVYFVSKDRNESSHLHSAVEYTGLQKRDSLVKLYRQGFFGARPSNLEESYDILEIINNEKDK